MADDGGNDERTEGERPEDEGTQDQRPEDERWEAEARSTGPRENTDGVTQADAGLQGAEGTARPTDETPVEPKDEAPVEPRRDVEDSGEEEEEGGDEGDRDPS